MAGKWTARVEKEAAETVHVFLENTGQMPLTWDHRAQRVWGEEKVHTLLWQGSLTTGFLIFSITHAVHACQSTQTAEATPSTNRVMIHPLRDR